MRKRDEDLGTGGKERVRGEEKKTREIQAILFVVVKKLKIFLLDQ